MINSLRLLVIADVHYVGSARHECAIAARRTELGLELVQRVCGWAERTRFAPSAVVLLGDLVDNGAAEGAQADLHAIRKEALRLGVPLIAIPGNHDGPRDLFESVFGACGGIVELEEGVVVPFVDPYDSLDRCQRAEGSLAGLADLADRVPRLPIVAIQHNPVHPRIESSYPYMLENGDDVMEAYRAAGVALSLSGHYHAGQPATEADGVIYATCPALCEAPYSFLTVDASARGVQVRRHDLQLCAPSCSVFIEDCHCHTQFAYCASDITVDGALARGAGFGVGRQNFTEHAGQLYITREDFWGARFLRDPDCWLRERAAGHGRMRGYLRTLAPMRKATVGLGLEADCDGAGRLMVAEEDRASLDLLVGAVHFLPETVSAGPRPAQVSREFMEYTGRLVHAGVDVLAHPFRLFEWAKLPPPTELYAPVAELLASHGCAAELNMHFCTPDPRFYAACMQRGVKIALGSDAHSLWEVGSFHGHLEVLRAAGATGNLDEVLFTTTKPSAG